MAPLVINVTGTATFSHKAELAVLSVTISSQSTSRAQANKDVAQTTQSLQTLLKSLSSPQSSSSSSGGGGNTHPASASPATALPPHQRTTSTSSLSAAHPSIHTWTMSTLTTTSHTPLDSAYNPIPDAPKTHTARTSFSVSTRNFPALGALAQQLFALGPAVKLQGISWALTDGTRKSYERVLRKAAARDALMRAEDYAEALGRGSVRPVEVREYRGGVEYMAAEMVQGAVGRGLVREEEEEEDGERGFEDVVFEPEEIKMQAEVEGKFEAT